MKTKLQLLTLFFFILFTSFSFSQERETLNKHEEDTLTITPRYTKETAILNIKSGIFTLVLPGGIISAPTKEGDKAFSEKYNVKFISQSCTRLPGEKFLEYNQEMFHYLDEKYGTGWRSEIRQDVIGLNIKE